MRLCHPVLLVLAALLVAPKTPQAAPIDFNRDIRPILATQCFACHGPDGGRRKAGLRLDLRESALEKHAIHPGHPSQSRLLTRVFSEDPEEQMPPPASRKSLTPDQKNILRRWIEQGAPYQQHWAYEKPVRTKTQAGTHPVDFLVAIPLAAAGIAASPEADRRTLLRRVHADLTGLPPTPDEVRAFEDDPAPDAYTRRVDQLLQSPHFGERMAIHWLDVVRFADTIGYHSDNPRNVWPYRDWVIRSFNQNKPFDRFTLEQIAGDLLPDSDRETRVGSAFNRLLQSTEEGGAQPKDYEARMLADRVRAIGTVWLGHTTGCAQCHDHKFDPFTMRDFYALGAFFADIREEPVGRREDGMTVATAEQEAELATLDKTVARTRAAIERVAPQLDAAQAQWERDVLVQGGTLPECREGSTTGESARKTARLVLDSLQKEPATRNENEKKRIRDYFRNHAAAVYRAELDALAAAAQRRDSFLDQLPKCLVTVSTPRRRIVRLLPRGNWMDESGEIMKPALPRHLAGAPDAGRELTRLDLAQWLVSRDNPLTARTVMNRLWQQLFGTGLSRVVHDLGVQGDPPSNPALLDWLACEFMDSGWNMKHMVRLIVTSATYRQSSSAPASVVRADPENRLFSRQARFRLDAELIRDHALAVSGLLSLRIGGPSVKPYQPERYWENLNFPTRDYLTSTGDDQYRRGLYSWWQRSFLHPALLAFDAPNRDECTAERNRSNLPQQALVLLNDPTYVEAARALATRALSESPGDSQQRIDWMWQQVLQRSPDDRESTAMSSLLSHHRAGYASNPAAADAMLRTGQASVPRGLEKTDLAAWTHLARVLLNLHETITRN